MLTTQGYITRRSKFADISDHVVIFRLDVCENGHFFSHVFGRALILYLSLPLSPSLPLSLSLQYSAIAVTNITLFWRPLHDYFCRHFGASWHQNARFEGPQHARLVPCRKVSGRYLLEPTYSQNRFQYALGTISADSGSAVGQILIILNAPMTPHACIFWSMILLSFPDRRLGGLCIYLFPLSSMA